MMWQKNFTNLSLEEKTAYMNLMMKNIQYLDNHMVFLILDFYRTFTLAVIERNSRNKDVRVAIKCLDERFNRVTIKILSKTSKLSKELHLPDFAKFATEQYSKLIKKDNF